VSLNVLRRGLEGVCRTVLRIGNDRRNTTVAAESLAEPDLDLTDDAILAYGDLVLNTRTREVWRGRRPIDLTRTEFRLLELFLRNPRQVLTREQIFERVWGFNFGPHSNTLSVYVGYLRRKTEAEGEPRLLHTIRGVGYMLRD
jgi:two-component system response regulator MprA